MPVKIVLVSLGILTLLRLQFGVDFSDESFYIAQTYRFILGDRPFVDDKLLLSTMAFVTQPLFWLFHRTTGDLTGVVLYFRVLYFTFSLLSAWIVYRSLVMFIRQPAACAIAAFPVLYIHHQMPSLSYNSMALHLWVIAIFSALPCLVDGLFRSIHVIVTTLATVLMGIVYPPLVGCGALFLLAIFIRTMTNWKKWMTPVIVGLSIAISFSFWIDHRFDVLREIVLVTKNAGGAGGIQKGMDCVTSLWHFTPLKWLIALFVLASILPVPRYLSWMIVMGWPGLPLILSKKVETLPGGFNMHVLGYPYFWALMCPVFLFLCRREVMARKLFMAIFPISLLSGITTAWAASYGLTTMGFVVGLFPAALLSLILFAQWADRITPSSWVPYLLVTLLCLLYYQRVPFKDEPVTRLTTRISDGPFAGLLTTRERAIDEYTMRQDIERFAPPDGKIFVYESMPALYLYTKARPLAQILYKTCMAGREGCKRSLEDNRVPILVIHIKPYRYNLDVLSSVENHLKLPDPVTSYVEKRYELIEDSPHYRLYRGSS